MVKKSVTEKPELVSLEELIPRLKQVSRVDASDNVLNFCGRLFGDRDPVPDFGNANGTSGSWWPVFTLAPYIFDHITSDFGMVGVSSRNTVKP